ncbi:MAG: TetR/AcrR family transcriptional regulator [Sphingomicrobium sp.]
MNDSSSDAGALASRADSKARASVSKPDPQMRNGRRTPTQDRSQASLERILKAALHLMSKRASEDFTLQEVSSLGRVSIGSIYHQFQSKDDIVRAVIARELADIAEIERAALKNALLQSETLVDFVPRFVNFFSQSVREHSLIIRLAMRRATIDVEVSNTGDDREQESAEALAEALRAFGDEIAGDVTYKSAIIFHVIFSALARNLSLNTSLAKPNAPNWKSLTEELSIMALAYLKSGSPRVAGNK